MSLKPIKLFGHVGGPNPWKVAIILEELGLPYEEEIVDMAVMHTPAYEKYNPNGRVPAIVDPNNNDFTIWESGAIIEYLIDRYDKSNKLHSPPGTNDFYLEKQYLHFQMSGQGPYFGQAMWFTYYHSEQVESAKQRYVKETRRITGVLDAILKKRQAEGKNWLVGDKVSYADLAFVPWYWLVSKYDQDFDQLVDKEYPAFKKWIDALQAREVVTKLREKRAALMKQKQ